MTVYVESIPYTYGRCKHFMSLGTPLKNIELYPSKVAQMQRFLKQVCELFLGFLIKIIIIFLIGISISSCVGHD